MNLPRISTEYEGGVEEFIEFAQCNASTSGDDEIGQEGSPTPKNTHLSEDDPLGALDELAKIISDAPMNVHLDSTTFGREAQIPLYLLHQDVRELASGREEINITLIQLWMTYMFDVSNKKGFNDVYGFIDPSMNKHTSPPALEWGRRYIFSLIYLATFDLHTGEHCCLVLFIAQVSSQPLDM
ncbi:hypothetical protein LR48_Vigan08g046300 [Vigna angularis]|uniref:Uncharacterized protein n=1 Tax=Phaseolus angularis TaxID=3914 RepID=A0A0L9V3T3_PHAAN|nr:hypothetical protein LR48_Vigan08g046300 [Vigna angularis]